VTTPRYHATAPPRRQKSGTRKTQFGERGETSPSLVRNYQRTHKGSDSHERNNSYLTVLFDTIKEQDLDKARNSSQLFIESDGEKYSFSP
jgi:hypothetical protein